MADRFRTACSRERETALKICAEVSIARLRPRGSSLYPILRRLDELHRGRFCDASDVEDAVFARAALHVPVAARVGSRGIRGQLQGLHCLDPSLAPCRRRKKVT